MTKFAAPTDWAETLAEVVRTALARMDTTLTLSEAKTELTRHLVELRQVWEAEGHEAAVARA